MCTLVSYSVRLIVPALSILALSNAFNFSDIHPVFNSLIVFANRSSEMQLKCQEITDEGNLTTAKISLRTIIQKEELHRIISSLYGDQVETHNFSFIDDSSASLGLNNSGNSSQRDLGNRETKDVEDSIRKKRNIDYLEEDYLEESDESDEEALDPLLDFIQNGVKSALKEALVRSERSKIVPKNQLLIIDQIENVLLQTMELLRVDPEAEMKTKLLHDVFRPENEMERKLRILYLQALIVYQEIASRRSRLWNQGYLGHGGNYVVSSKPGKSDMSFKDILWSEGKVKQGRRRDRVETSTSIFDGLDELNERVMKESRRSKGAETRVIGDIEIQNLLDLLYLHSIMKKSGSGILHRTPFNLLEAKENLLTGSSGKESGNSSIITITPEIAAQMNRTSARIILQYFKDSWSDVNDFAESMKKWLNLTGTPDREKISKALAVKLEGYSNGKEAFLKMIKEKMSEFEKESNKKGIEAQNFQEKNSVQPSQRGFLDDLIEHRESLNTNSEEILVNEPVDVIDAIIATIDLVIPPSMGENQNESLSDKKAAPIEDRHFKKVLESETVD